MFGISKRPHAKHKKCSTCLRNWLIGMRPKGSWSREKKRKPPGWVKLLYLKSLLDFIGQTADWERQGWGADIQLADGLISLFHRLFPLPAPFGPGTDSYLGVSPPVTDWGSRVKSLTGVQTCWAAQACSVSSIIPIPSDSVYTHYHESNGSLSKAISKEFWISLVLN